MSPTPVFMSMPTVFCLGSQHDSVSAEEVFEQFFLVHGRGATFEHGNRPVFALDAVSALQAVARACFAKVLQRMFSGFVD